MKKRACVSLTAERQCHRELWKDGETTLLSAELAYYTFQGDKKNTAADRITRYYIHAKNALLRHCKTQILPALLRQERAARENGTPFSPLMVSAVPQITYNANGVLSLYTDILQRGEGLNAVLRLGDVWSLSNGCPLSISSFYPKNCNYRRMLREQIRERIAFDLQVGYALYYQDYARLLVRHFSSANYYITESGLVTFYPQGSIAPDVEGTPAFVHTWNPAGPIEPLLLL